MPPYNHLGVINRKQIKINMVLSNSETGKVNSQTHLIIAHTILSNLLHPTSAKIPKKKKKKLNQICINTKKYLIILYCTKTINSLSRYSSSSCHYMHYTPPATNLKFDISGWLDFICLQEISIINSFKYFANFWSTVKNIGWQRKFDKASEQLA